MHKSTIRRLQFGWPQHVVAHGTRQQQRGRRPALPFRGIVNPREAFVRARDIVEADSEVSSMTGWMAFSSDLPFRTDLDTEVDTHRVVLAASRGSRKNHGDLGHWLDTISQSAGITPERPYAGVISVEAFWRAFWDCDDYMTNPHRRLPALVISSGLLRREHQETVEVADRIKEICEANEVPWAQL
jgi:hypothetical protein